MPTKRNRSLLILRTIPKLGILNVAAVAKYRAAVSLNLIQPPNSTDQPLPPFLHAPGTVASPELSEEATNGILAKAQALQQGLLYYFSSAPQLVGSPPDWCYDPYTSEITPNPQIHWSKVKEFQTGSGDIKALWEASRFGWAPQLASAYAITKDSIHLNLLNRWIEDWVDKNPAEQGINWKCGQECALRMLNLLLTAALLGDLESPSSGLLTIIQQHVERIEKNTSYALAQDNNHAISETLALYIGGNWLAAHGPELERKRAQKLAKRGLSLFESTVLKLVLPDGSFSQRSLNYHRFLVDFLSLAMYWTNRLELPDLSEDFTSRAQAATDWLFEMVDEHTGGCPNFGGNDGALVVDSSSCPYDDFRPSVQLAQSLLTKERAYPKGPWDEACAWLQSTPSIPRLKKRSSQEFRDGGYVTIHGQDSFMFLHAPSFRFRPAHADALHCDLWIRGENVLRDSGTYSYKCEEELLTYFGRHKRT